MWKAENYMDDLQAAGMRLKTESPLTVYSVSGALQLYQLHFSLSHLIRSGLWERLLLTSL